MKKQKALSAVGTTIILAGTFLVLWAMVNIIWFHTPLISPAPIESFKFFLGCGVTIGTGGIMLLFLKPSNWMQKIIGCVMSINGVIGIVCSFTFLTL